MNRRLKCILAAELIALGFTLVLVIPNAVEAWTSVHLSAHSECVDGRTTVAVTADNTESEAAHVVAESGGAWAVGDDIPKPGQTRDVTITGATLFQVTVNYPSDSTYRPSNTVTVDVVQGCHVTTTSSSTTSTSTSSTSTSTTQPATTSTTECVKVGDEVTCDHPSTTVPASTTTRPSTTSTPSTATSVPTTPPSSGTVVIVPPADVTAVSATPAFTG